MSNPSQLAISTIPAIIRRLHWHFKSKSSSEHFEISQAQLNKNNMRRAIRWAQKGVYGTSTPSITHVAHLASLYVQAGKVNHFRRLWKKHPLQYNSKSDKNSSAALSQLAVQLYKNDLLQEAEHVATLALQYNVDSAQMTDILWQTYDRTGRIEEALSLARTRLEGDPKDLKVLHYLAKRSYKTGSMGKAFSYALKTRKAYPQDEYAHEITARIYYKYGNYIQAMNFGRKILEINPKNGMALQIVMRSLTSLQRWKDIIEIGEKHIALLRDEKNLVIYYTKACNKHQHSLKFLIDDLKNVLRTRHAQSKHHVHLARIYDQQRNWYKAIYHWQEAIKLSKHDVMNWFYLIRQLSYLGDMDRVDEVFREAESSFAAAPQGHANIAKLALLCERYDYAQSYIKKTKAQFRHCGKSQFLIGEAIYRAGMLSQAAPYLKRAAELNANISQSHDLLQDIDKKLSLIKKAEDAIFPDAILKEIITHRTPPPASYERPKKILLSIFKLGPGGAERQVVNTALGLIEQKLAEEVIILCRSLEKQDSFFLHKLDNPKIRVLNLFDESEPSEKFHKRAILDKRIHELLSALPSNLEDGIVRMLQVFQKEQPDVVHAWLDSINISAAVAAILSDIPNIFIGGRNTVPTHPMLHRFGRRYFQPTYQQLLYHPRVKMLHNSHAGAKDYADWLDVPLQKFSVIHNGVDFKTLDEQSNVEIEDLSRIQEKSRASGGPIIGSVFRLMPQKRPHLWVEAASLVIAKIPNAQFVIVGDGPERTSVEAYAEKLGISDHIHLVGNSKTPGAWYRSMDLFFLTSEIEGLPNVVIEALGCGVPVVSSLTGGVEEIIDEGNTGWIVRSEEAKEYAQKIIWCLQNTQWMTDAAERALATRQKFSLNRMVTNTFNAYEESAQKRETDETANAHNEM